VGSHLPVGTLLFVGARQAVPWFLAFVALVAVSAAVDPTLAAGAPDIPNGLVVTFFPLNVLGVSTTVHVLLQYLVRARERALADSERLLLNVLPAPVASRLKQSEQVIADGYAAATVLFRGHRRLYRAR
jgi:adenylate cyclase